eukprot:162858-Chlamydomonas_euryale.AAC.8
MIEEQAAAQCYRRDRGWSRRQKCFLLGFGRSACADGCGMRAACKACESVDGSRRGRGRAVGRLPWPRSRSASAQRPAEKYLVIIYAQRKRRNVAGALLGGWRGDGREE